MSLSGKLEIFPLEEVLRLLARSHQSGCLRVEGAGAGRIYLENGSLTYASVEADEALRAHLLAAGIVTEPGLEQVDRTRGSLTEALAPGASTAALGDVIREQCVESVYRIRRPAGGPFSFTVDTQPRYATGQSYDIEMIISEADRRAAEWADIEDVVPDLATAWRMVPEVDEESVTLSDVAWRFLAALEGSSSVSGLASRLGLTEFQAARRMAELSRAHLVQPVVATADAPAVQSTVAYQAPVLPSEQPAWADAGPEGGVVPEPVEATVASEGKADQSWWQEPTAAATEEAPEAPAVEPEGSFLENVFGELDETAAEAAEEATPEKSDDSDEGDGGFGLLRRRGLGAAFRELADS